MPLSGPEAAACLNAAFTASAVVAFSTSATSSTIETSGVGTRSEMPSIFPFTSGITRPVAFAAQVLVRQIENLLVVGVAVHGGHEAVLEPEIVDHDLHHRHEAVRRARGVGDDG